MNRLSYKLMQKWIQNYTKCTLSILSKIQVNRYYVGLNYTNVFEVIKDFKTF